jgi:hypothetical protein
MNVFGDVEARAVVGVQAPPVTLWIALDALLLLRVLFLQPMVAEQQLRCDCVLEPGRDANGHGRPSGAGRGDATRLASECSEVLAGGGAFVQQQ